METLFKRYFWVANVVLLGVTGYATARAASSYVEYEVFKVPFVEQEGEMAAGAEEEEMGFRRPLGVSRVDADRRGALLAGAGKPAEEKKEEIATVKEEAAPETGPIEEPQAAGGPLTLVYIAAITTTDDEANNLALVKVDGGDNRWVGVGDTLKPGYTVTKITNYYILVSQGVTELLWKKSEEKPPAAELAGGGRERPGPRPGPEEKKPEEKKPEEKKDQTPYAQGVKQTGPYEYQIDRAMLNEQLGDLAKLGREARVIPNYDRDSGTYKGFKLIGVRPNSLYRAIGIRSGDVIMQINGEELSSPSKALELFTKLQNSNEITLDIMRGGKKQTLQYKIE